MFFTEFRVLVVTAVLGALIYSPSGFALLPIYVEFESDDSYVLSDGKVLDSSEAREQISKHSRNDLCFRAQFIGFINAYLKTLEDGNFPIDATALLVVFTVTERRDQDSEVARRIDLFDTSKYIQTGNPILISSLQLDPKNCGFPADSFKKLFNKAPLEYQKSLLAPSTVTEDVFNDVIDEIRVLYKPQVRRLHQKLVIERQWWHHDENLTARREEEAYTLLLSGGWARQRGMTKDTFRLSVCHEVGHLLGGGPYYQRSDDSLLTYMNAEGEAEYFATSKCLRKLFSKEDNVRIAASLPTPDAIREACSRAWSTVTDRAICERVGYTALLEKKVLADSLNRNSPPGTPVIQSPRSFLKDATIVNGNVLSHPNPQCRFDTLLAGALCTTSYEISPDLKDFAAGTCTIEGGFSIGLRPTCWFNEDAARQEREQLRDVH